MTRWILVCKACWQTARKMPPLAISAKCSKHFVTTQMCVATSLCTPTSTLNIVYNGFLCSLDASTKCAMILITRVVFIHTNTSYLIIKLVITHMTNACTKYVHFHNKLNMCAKSILLTCPAPCKNVFSTLNTPCSSLAGRIYTSRRMVSKVCGLRQKRPQAKAKAPGATMQVYC